MFAKILVKAAVVGGVVAGAVHLVRKHDLVAKGAAKAEDLLVQANKGANKLIVKAVEVTDSLLTRFDETVGSAPTHKPTDKFEAARSRARADGVGHGGVPADVEDPWTAATRDSRS